MYLSKTLISQHIKLRRFEPRSQRRQAIVVQAVSHPSPFRPGHTGYEVIRDHEAGFIYSITGLAPVHAMGFVAINREAIHGGIHVPDVGNEINLGLSQIDGHEFYYALVAINPGDTRITKKDQMPAGCKLFYFRARYGAWLLDVDGKEIAMGRYENAGNMPFSDAEGIIRTVLAAYRQRMGAT